MTAGKYTREFANGTIDRFTRQESFNKTQVRTDLGGPLTGDVLNKYFREQDALFMSKHPDLYTREIPQVVEHLQARRSGTQSRQNHAA